MTTLDYAKYTCPLCGEKFEASVLTSSSSFGAADLDGRPAPLIRDTLNIQLNKCPHCGFACFGLPDSTSISKEFVESEKYINADGIDFKIENAKIMYQASMIAEEEREPGKSTFLLHRCAWLCDDEGDEENSVRIRIILNDKMSDILENDEDAPEDLWAVKADVMRRARLFDELIEEYEGKTFKEPFFNNLIKFQIEKSKEKDSKVYTLDIIEGYEDF